MIGLCNRGTYTRLLVSLALVVILTPFFSLVPGGRILLNLAFVGVIIAAVWDIARTPRLLVFGITLGLPAMAVRITAAIGGSQEHILRAFVEGLAVLFFAYAIVEIVWDIAVSSDVTNDTIRFGTPFAPTF